jgi:hypothetical protein
MKPERVFVPLFDMVPNPQIRLGEYKLIQSWRKAFFNVQETYHRIFRLQLSSYTNKNQINKIEDFILDTVTKYPDQIDILREVIAMDFPQYKDMADKIIMLQ